MQYAHLDFGLSSCIGFCSIEHIYAIVPCRLDDFLEVWSEHRQWEDDRVMLAHLDRIALHGATES